MRAPFVFAPLALTLVVLSCFALTSAAAAQEAIGHVSKKKFTGARGFIGEEGGYIYFNDDVYRDERIVCGQGVETTLRFEDTTKLQIGPNSEVILDEFVYNEADGAGEMAVELSSGMFRFITGNMATTENITLGKPNAVVAIRGTDVIVAHIDGVTEVSVLEGEVEVFPRGAADGGSAAAGQTASVASPASAVAVSQGLANVGAPGMADNPY